MDLRSRLRTWSLLLLPVALGVAIVLWTRGSGERDSRMPQRAIHEDEVQERPGAPLSKPQSGLVDAQATPQPAQAPPALDEPKPTTRLTPQPRSTGAALTPDGGGVNLEQDRTLHVLVLDEVGVPVPRAGVRVLGVANSAQPDSVHRYPDGHTPRAITDDRGRARLEHWAWIDPITPTDSVRLTVEHLDYTPLQDAAFSLGSSPCVVVLMGLTGLAVSAWFDSPDEPLLPIDISLDGGATWPDLAWRTLEGGRRRVELDAGNYTLRVRHESGIHGTLFSAPQVAVLASGEVQSFHLELEPAVSLRGKLEASVPRPVQDGRVRILGWAPATRPEKEDSPEYLKWVTEAPEGGYEAPIQPDGSFLLEGVPSGDARLVALASGWALRHAEGRPFEVELPTQDPLVLPMERTARVSVRVEAGGGLLLEDALVGVLPMGSPWDGSGFMKWRDWFAQTDERGLAVVHDIPAGLRVRVYAEHREYALRVNPVDGLPEVASVSGEAAEITLSLTRR